MAAKKAKIEPTLLQQAKAGNAQAMFRLSLTLPDHAEAALWLRKAAVKGVAPAQNNLGVMLENGEGVARNYEEAMKWYRKAAESGNRDAPNNIGVMYMTGVGVRRDFVKASMWFNIAGKGDLGAASNKGFLIKRMTPDEIAQAESLAKEWLKIRSQ